MKCPQCAQELKQVTYETVAIHTCASCGGEFIGTPELGHIVRARQERFSPELRELLAQRTPRPGVAADAHPALCCPGCGEPMTVISYGGDSGVFVDRCASCDGMWLDCEELQRIQVLQERWAEEAPDQLKQISVDLEKARWEVAQATSSAFAGSRFAFINALINRYLDAA